MDVLEDEQRRPFRGHGLDEVSNREEEALAVRDRPFRVEAEEDPEVPRHLLRLGLGDE